MSYCRHKSAYVDESSEIGDGINIRRFSQMLSKLRILKS